MGRWRGLSSLIDFHFDHGDHSYRNGNLTTRYHKLDDSIFVLCRNCGQSMKSEEDDKKMSPSTGARLKANPKHFLTWSTTAANSRIQKMSKNLVNNISKLHMKVEKAIPFQGILLSSDQVCSAACESANGNITDHHYMSKKLDDQENNNTVMTPDVVQTNLSVSKDCKSPSGIQTTSDQGRDDKMIQQNAEVGNLPYHPRVQNARIVQSHPSVSHSHSLGCVGSIANPDKILQYSIETFDKYAPKELNTWEILIEKPPQVKYSETRKRKDELKIYPEGSGREGNMELCYDSGTGTSMSDSSLSSVATLPISSPSWSSSKSVSTLEDTNLNSSSNQNQKFYNNSKSKKLNNANVTKSHLKNVSFSLNNGKEASQDSNSTNSGVPITESTDETSLLIDNKKSTNKKGSRKNNSSNVRNVEICNNNKNLVPTQDQKLGSSPLDKIQALISPIYPPSKLAVTIFEEEAELRHSPWFQAGIPREIALEVLKNEPIGTFIVRESTTKSGCFALSLRVPKEYQPNGIAHYLIFKTSRGYKIKGFTKEFGSLISLITHHSVMPELLPCPLSLHRYLPKFPLKVSRANSSDFMEPDKFIIRSFTHF